MRVLIVTHYLGDAFPHGLEQVITRLSTELRKVGDDVATVTTREPGTRREVAAAPKRSRFGMTVFPIAGGPLDPLGLPETERETERQLDQVLDEWRPDIVHFTLLHGLHPNVARHVQRRGTPVLVDVHSYEAGCPRLLLRKDTGESCAGPNGGRECAATCFAGLPDALPRLTARARGFEEAVREADAVTACSPFVARWLHDTCGLPEPQVVSPPIAPPPPQLPLELRETPVTRGRLNLAMIGPVGTAKGIGVAVEAIAGAGLASTQLLVLGPVIDSELASAMRQCAARVAGFELVLAGSFEPAALSLLLSDVDLLIVASQGPEKYSLAAREAWSRGIPVIASRLGALTEAIREGENGLTFSHDDPSALGEALKHVAERPALLRHMRQGSLATPYVVPGEYAATIRQVYATVVDRGRSAGSDDSVVDATGPVVSPPRSTKRARGWARQREVGTSSHRAVFTDIYERELWRVGGESSSGPGSQREHTTQLQHELPELLARLGVHRLLDIGCGDFNWMRDVELGTDLYVGVDVVFDVVLNNRLEYGNSRRHFLQRDVTRDPLPQADLVLCRDVLIHFPDDDLVTAMQAIIGSGARYLMAGTFVDRRENRPIALGDWRPVNLRLPPLSMPPPLDWLVETPPESGYDDKRLAVWDLTELR
ncbi:MAG: glycosyltransferase [Solirubrobacteraceae bacterium]